MSMVRGKGTLLQRGLTTALCLDDQVAVVHWEEGGVSPDFMLLEAVTQQFLENP